MNPRLADVVGLFIQKGWTVTSQTEHSASLQKKASSTGLAIILGIIALAIFLFTNLLYGIIALVAALLLIALNNVTKKSGTAQISVLQDGRVQINSNIKSINRTYTPDTNGHISVFVA